MAWVDVAWVDVAWADQVVRIEHAWVGVPDPAAPLIVFLHEGLGSVSMWRDFPQRLCLAAGCRGLVYSRPGYGRSTPRAADAQWAPDFMHRQADEVLPALLAALQINPQAQPLWLLGHSDGGSIALLYAAHFANQVAGAIVLAPHISVEDKATAAINQARQAYLQADLRARLARHHDEPDSAFWGWNNIWLHPAFRSWNIASEISTITAPLLAVQGVDDEYGTLDQIHGIARRVPHATLLALPACGHSPHRDQAQALTEASTRFVQAHRGMVG